MDLRLGQTPSMNKIQKAGKQKPLCFIGNFLCFNSAYWTRVSLSRLQDSQSDTQHSVGLLWFSDGPSQRPLPDNTQQSQKTTSMPPPGFKPAIPTSKRPHSHSLDRAATGIGVQMTYRAMKYKGGVISFHVTNTYVGRRGVILLFIQIAARWR